MTRRSLLLAVLINLAPTLSGCSSEAKVPPTPKTVPVRGTVLYKGKPIANVLVTLNPLKSENNKGWKSTGMTDKQGKFVISTGAPDNGAPLGEYQVTFKLVTVVDTDPEGGNMETERDAWKGKYANKDSGPKVEIRDGENELEPFKLD